jgi:coenzyme F420 hydrogenase subunit beta
MLRDRRLKTIADIAGWRLCLGCGACAYVCPERVIDLVDVPDEGIRPVIRNGDCGTCRACLQVCPVLENDQTEALRRPKIIGELFPHWGPVLEIWEGHAADPETRFKGSSGGALTALASYCLEQRAMHGVLHIGENPENPIRNKTALSRTRAELLARTGSRYAPASACDSLHLIEQAPAPCAFIGQPAEVVALRKAAQLRPALAQRLGLAMSFFCAGSPATRGTIELLRKLGIEPSQVGDLRYRGEGWPGHFAVTARGQSEPSHRLTYEQSWAFLQKYRPCSIHLWPDDTGEAADISCGDPWYRDVKPDEPGSSLLVVRTELGRDIVRGAIHAGYMELAPAEPWKLEQSQRNLLNKRRAIWGRRMAFRLFGLPVSRLKGFPLFRLWLGSSLKDKLKSTLGTARRIVQRRYYRPLELTEGVPKVCLSCCA